MPPPSKILNPASALPPRVLFVIKLTSILAMLDAAYLASVSLSRGALPGCGPSSSCQELLASRWAYVLGVPVSLLASLVYGTVFVAACRLNERRPASELRKIWAGSIGCSLLMIFAAAWFVCLQLFVMKKICPFCMTAHACASIAAATILLRAPIRSAPAQAWKVQKAVFIDPGLVKKIALASVAGVAVLIGAQTLHHPRTYLVKSVSAGPVAESKTEAARLFSIYQGKFQLNLNEEPLIGLPTAPHVIVSLFDYTCPHCQTTHRYLKQVQKTFGNQLAIVNLTMPLDGKCNPAIKPTQPLHADACEYARIGLAVWRANKRVAENFDDWMFRPSSPPPLAEARRYAATLVGQDVLTRALEQDWIGSEIKRNVAIYQISYLEDRRGMLPQLIIGDVFIAGPPNEAGDLYRIIGQEFGLVAGH
jgi:uncharacterized membrane protein